MVASTKQTLLHFEDLTLPSFQVIVMTANMGCAQCRKKVSHVISKMTGLREYIVDVSKEQVIVKADFGLRWNVKDGLPNKSERRNLWAWPPLQLFRCLSLNCFSKGMVVAA